MSVRSLIAPIYLIASVALSFFAALGLSVILFIKIGGKRYIHSEILGEVIDKERKL